MNQMTKPAATYKGTDHWTTKDNGAAKLFMFNKCDGDPAKAVGTILFVHGSSMAGQPTFDLQVPGRPFSSSMDYFASIGFDVWTVDMEGYGRSTKDRDNNAPISQGADDCYAAAQYIQKLRGNKQFMVYGISSGALRAAMFAERHPELVARLALDAFVWTGEGSPTLAERKKKLPFLPEVIGVITSPTGAVIRDIMHRLDERFPRNVLLWPVLVQGQTAAASVIAAIKGFNALPKDSPHRPDLLIVARGRKKTLLRRRA